MKTPITENVAAVASTGLVLPFPSWFATQGIPRCSKWGKTEIEYLAWAYMATMARDGDTWHPVTTEKCQELLDADELRIVGCFGREGLYPTYQDWWDMIARQLQDADGAFEVAGLAWTRWKFNRENVDVMAPAGEKTPPKQENE